MEKRFLIGRGIQKWKSSSLLLLFGAALLICSIVYVCLPGKTYTMYVPLEGTEEEKTMQAGEGRPGADGQKMDMTGSVEMDKKKGQSPSSLPQPSVGEAQDGPSLDVALELEQEFEGEEVFRMEEMTAHEDYMEVKLVPVEDGQGQLSFVNPKEGTPIFQTDVKVDRFGHVYDSTTKNYGGYEWVLLSLTLFFLAASGSLAWDAAVGIRRDHYDYQSVFRIGFSLFLLALSIILGTEWVRMKQNPMEVTRRDVLMALAESGHNYMRFTLPFVCAFAIAMTVSNLVLLQKEGRRLTNVVGMFLGIVLLFGEWLGVVLTDITAGPMLLRRLGRAIVSVYTSGFVYLECLLIGTIICSLLAVRHIPERDKDFLVILGCGFAKDGTLYPLLRGRVDKAIEFWHQQRLETGKKAIFVPSGGQGRDEPMAEAQAMRRYLITQGFQDCDILMESRSRNTYENMLFSRRLIDRVKEGARAAFVTTNYHMFRSGILARKVGFSADGLGSYTKWYFWPNAFVREFFGLIDAQFSKHIGVLVIMIISYSCICMMVY